jgi:hypothetical protein
MILLEGADRLQKAAISAHDIVRSVRAAAPRIEDVEDEGENEAADPEAEDVPIDRSIPKPASFGSD